MQGKQKNISCQNRGYPIFLSLHDKPVVVIGGGTVAERKVKTLIRYGAHIRVISPELTHDLAQLERTGVIDVCMRTYEPGDLKGAVLAFCAAGAADVDMRVRKEAKQRNCLLNVADVPAQCDFCLPSVMQRGRLQIAVFTNGAACTETKNIRRHLEEEYDETWEPYLDLLFGVRQLVKERIEGQEEHRKPIFEAATRLRWRERLAAGEVISLEDAYAEAVYVAQGE